MDKNQKEAFEITCKRFNECLNNFSQFKTEKEVKNFLEKDLIVSFPTIVASGQGASLPHYDGEKKLEKGFCVLDFGILHEGICTDVSRTIYIGKPSKEEISLYNYLLYEHKKCLKKVKLNSNARYIEKSLRKRLKEKNKLFIHSLSHGLGNVVHEPLPKRLKKLDLITIEPGFYKKDEFGIRIEDDVYINEEGKPEILTKKIPKQLIILEKPL